jgi:predicted secreted hydrolase
MGLAEAKSGLVDVWIDNWSLQQQGNRYRTSIRTPEFQFDFVFNATQSPMLNGERGYSQKSPNPLAASYYYSIPQLQVSGSLTRHGKRQTITGIAWFDHEWSSEYMDPRAAGWDWAGINVDDGSALMAFSMRSKTGSALWAGGTYRSIDGTLRILRPEDISFTPAKRWRSPRSTAEYPIAMALRAGERNWSLTPLLEDQEIDANTTARATYWEGAVYVLQDGKRIGRGYLELTGYATAMKF